MTDEFILICCQGYPTVWISRPILSPTAETEIFVKVVNGFKLSTFLTRSSVLDVGEGPEYASNLFKCMLNGDKLNISNSLSK